VGNNTFNSLFVAGSIVGIVCSACSLLVQYTPEFTSEVLSEGEWDVVITCILISMLFLAASGLWIMWLERSLNPFRTHVAWIILIPISESAFFYHDGYRQIALAVFAATTLICHFFAICRLWPEE